MMVALYLRVSTLDQSVDMQRSDSLRYCEQRGFEVYREYIDHGVSGAKDHRPALNELMADARKRKFDVVLVWRFDRFARSTKHLVTALEEFRHLGIDFISYSESLDTSSPLGKVMFTIIAAMAEFEREIIRERIRGGLRKARRHGKRLGRRPTCFDLQADVRRLREENMSFREIARRIGKPKSTVYKAYRSMAA